MQSQHYPSRIYPCHRVGIWCSGVDFFHNFVVQRGSLTKLVDHKLHWLDELLRNNAPPISSM